jgi:hypothetical protein
VYTVTARGNGISGTMRVNQVTMLGGNSKVDFNTRVHQVGSISGVLFTDANQNGLRDPQESLLSGRTVYLDADNDGKHDDDEMSVQTDAAGAYRMTDLRPGSYTVRQILPAGWDSTVVDDPLTVALAAAEQRTGADLGSLHTNLAPVAVADSFSGQVGRNLTLDVFANDYDPDGELVLELTQIPVSPQHGTVALNKTTGMLVYTPQANYVGSDAFEYAVVDDGGLTSPQVRVSLTINPAVGKSWQNAQQPLDVNQDGFVTPIDALLVLNVINRDGAGPLSFPSGAEQPPPFLDVSGDGFVSPIDPLLVLNEINRIAAGRRTASPALIAAAVDEVFTRKSSAS